MQADLLCTDAACAHSLDFGVCRCPFLAGTGEAVLQQGQAELRAVNDHQQRQVSTSLNVYHA